ncbi:hypothetical protein GCM10011354_24500 [Egicoccus halophilus]|uniref:Uncharacterized protein n=1 Tax=Egicoccus halophilus TaxID=1670830 RepID=A0A8J3ABD8_9ACTN|nr:hypothetical protein GCM10011354_24500 [Egicoccus halophilus]
MAASSELEMAVDTRSRRTHHRALRALGNRLLGTSTDCLRHHTPYDEHTAWAHRMTLDSYDRGIARAQLARRMQATTTVGANY